MDRNKKKPIRVYWVLKLILFWVGFSAELLTLIISDSKAVTSTLSFSCWSHCITNATTVVWKLIIYIQQSFLKEYNFYVYITYFFARQFQAMSTSLFTVTFIICQLQNLTAHANKAKGFWLLMSNDTTALMISTDFQHCCLSKMQILFLILPHKMLLCTLQCNPNPSQSKMITTQWKNQCDLEKNCVGISTIL